MGGVNLNTKAKKKWSVLIYANGNNELEPEMWCVKQLAERLGSDENVHVILQLGREDRELAKIFRPGTGFLKPEEMWTGVRRYYVEQGHSVLQEDMGKINMAHPTALYEFLFWAMTSYPAQQYTLILGGHGYQFVGAMTDYSQSTPYIMGIPGISQGINMACCETGCKIDLLILDICYFNFIEVLYELGKYQEPSIDNVLTYIVNGPISGLPVNQIIGLLQQKPKLSARQITCELINRVPFVDLVAFEINHHRLETIKQSFHQLAQIYLTSSDKELSMFELLQSSKPELPWHNVRSQIILNMFSLIIHHKRNTNNHQSLINVANNRSSDRDKIALYSKLAFAKDNDWVYLLSDKTHRPQQMKGNELEPVSLKRDALYAYISTMNPYKNEEEKKNILRSLFRYRGWS